ncbi:hypothetical protein BHF71_06725 [Vulcanibacillus modesticaldus]|uniref:Putative phosphoesterase BHF71_06725 n=1 Tax=Vulcanibacillus modesticaldus TaxID=337097 RepID=A0A1D2YWG8_9BACI|nr:2'-5' RNA ligase family protein [Vulcanibacillus modesticaldus]OEG00050.1 hypothetical protein BHF71_06725 [Vulcanibacillus modesticaldus]
MKFGIVIFPSIEVQERANALRKRYDSHYNLIPPHITIKEAFELDSPDKAIAHLESVTKIIPPFNLKLNKIKSFYPISPVLYCGVEDDPIIYHLHEKINSGVLYHETKHKFTPHLTIAQDLPDQEIHDIYSRLKLKDFNMTFPVEQIHLCYQTETGSWEVYQSFPLRGDRNDTT